MPDNAINCYTVGTSSTQRPTSLLVFHTGSVSTTIIITNGASPCWVGVSVVDPYTEAMQQRVDGRRVRGDRTRRAAARCAAEIATVSGLDSVSISQVAAATGLSKSGILTVFPNREAVQLAAVEEARHLFVEKVIMPAWMTEPGTKRLAAILDNWFGYVRSGVFPGGCFMAATSAEFGARQGPVADAVREMKTAWIGLLEGELRVGREDSDKSRAVVTAAAFELDAFTTAGNTRFQLLGDPRQLDLARAACQEAINRFA